MSESLAAFSVLVFAFLLITGEAETSILPSSSSPSKSSFSKSSTTKSSYSNHYPDLTTIHPDQDQKSAQAFKIPRLGLTQVDQDWSSKPKEWSHKALANWCYGDDMLNEESQRGGERVRCAEMQLKSILCHAEHTSTSRLRRFSQQSR